MHLFRTLFRTQKSLKEDERMHCNQNGVVYDYECSMFSVAAGNIIGDEIISKSHSQIKEEN